MKPSTRLSTLKPEVRRHAASVRGKDESKLLQAFRGDLDRIVLKALEKDRTRRYETATTLAADIHPRPLRHVVIELFQQWLASSSTARESTDVRLTDEEMEQYPWLAITQPLVRSEMNHALSDIKGAVARGWSEERAQRFQRSENESRVTRTSRSTPPPSCVSW